MARPPHARGKVLRAYVELLVEGERSATMEAVAERAEVSKGGLLYHFPSKEALAEAVLEWFAEEAADDVAEMRTAPEGPARHFVRTSWQIDHDLDPVYRATLRLAQAGHQPALDALESVHRQWLALIEEEVGDPGLARTVMLIGDGLYHQAGMPGLWSTETFEDLTDLLVRVDQLIGR